MLALCAWLAIASAEPLVDQGEKLYTQGDYLGAVRLLERVLASGSASPGRARLYLAASHFAAGDRDAAQRVLSALFAEDPAATIDADAFPPPFVQAFEAARAASKKPEPAPTTTSPPPAAVEQPPAPPPPTLERKRSRAGWFPLALGVAAGGVGTYFLIHAQGVHSALTTPPTGASDVLPYGQGEQLASDGNSSQIVGWVLVSVGIAALVTAAALFLFARGDSS